MKVARVAAVMLIGWFIWMPGGATASPGTTKPGGDAGGTIAYVASVSKVGKTITVKYTMQSDDEWSLMRVTGVLDRTGGGRKQVDKYSTKECGKVLGKGVTKCTATITITDVSGKQHYWLLVSPPDTDTFATETSPGGSAHISCRGGIDCVGAHSSYQRNVYY